MIYLGYNEGEVTPEAKDLIDRLLELDSAKRLGSKNVEEIKNHPFFKGKRE
jgi:serine/threonine-protein kinase RIM15